jgi:1-acyl-sn-glycerol-3-phosphate acyltransferase
MESIRQRIARLDVPFNEYGYDRYGVSKTYLEAFFTVLALFYRAYFRVAARGVEHIPTKGRAMLVGNHSGGYAIDGAMVLAAAFLELDPPRLAHAMADRFLFKLPLSSVWNARCGQFLGLPENAQRLLEDERLLLVFPEGTTGTAKLFTARNSLVGFGHGFMRLALRTGTPIIPFGFAGGGEALPTIYNAEGLGRLIGVPYVPLTPWGLPIPVPVRCAVQFGKPLVFSGTGDEDDTAVGELVDQVKRAIALQIELAGRARTGES